MEQWEGGSQITSNPFDHVWTSNIVFPTTPGRLIQFLLSDWSAEISCGDSFSVSQQPPIWEPPSHYSMAQPETSIVRAWSRREGYKGSIVCFKPNRCARQSKTRQV